MRVGWGVDAHRFADEGSVRVCGVIADETRGVAATSDGDVPAHAVIDAVLGAAALGDIGALYPSDDERFRGADSMDLLADAVARVEAAGYSISSVDVTVIAQTVRIDPIRDEARARLAAVLGVGVRRVSLKATTTDAMGLTGRDEGLAAVAVAVLDED
jgi:2-C-methyl-D-erythritol 2,4-cyclodiphosphate synthase